jgi:hypothetical protein
MHLLVHRHGHRLGGHHGGHQPGSWAATLRLRAGVAKFYDRPAADVTGEPEPGQPSEASARIQVITARGTEDLDRHRAWDGSTTYDPPTGTIALGPFDDGCPRAGLAARRVPPC